MKVDANARCIGLSHGRQYSHGGLTQELKHHDRACSLVREVMIENTVHCWLVKKVSLIKQVNRASYR